MVRLVLTSGMSRDSIQWKLYPSLISSCFLSNLDSEQLNDTRDENLQVSNELNNINSQLLIVQNNVQLTLLNGVVNPLAGQASNIANNHHSQLSVSNRNSHVHGTSDNNINVVESMYVKMLKCDGENCEEQTDFYCSLW